MKLLTANSGVKSGITVVPADDGLVLTLVVFGKVLASVTRDDFDAMCARGHAVNEPVMIYTAESAATYPIGGCKILRADVELKGEEVYFIPETDENRREHVLLLNAWDAWMEPTMTCTAIDGASILARRKDEYWRNFVDLVHLPPASAVAYRKVVTLAPPKRSIGDRLLSLSSPAPAPVQQERAAGELRLSSDGATLSR